MNINQMGFMHVQGPSFEGMDGGGGGGSTGATSTGPVGGGSPTPASAPEPIKVSHESMIHIDGSDKPVKFGEHVKGLQSQFTKASQEAARLKEQVATIQRERDELKSASERAAQQARQGQQGDVYDALAQLPYLTGKDAVEVVKGIANQIQQRDMVLLGALKQMKALQGIVQGLHQTSNNSAFDAKITGWLKEGGYPDEAKDLAKEIYLAYEGSDLDNEFPQIFAQRWGQIEKILEAKRQQTINANRKARFVPGKGGDVRPSKPLEVKANTSSKDLADQLFGMFGENDAT